MVDKKDTPGGKDIDEQQDLRDAEPEGGPLERERQFLEERFTTLGPKGSEKERGAAEPGTPALDPEEEPNTPSGAPPLPANVRRKLVKKYRQRQRRQMGLSVPPAAAHEKRPEAEEKDE